MANTKFEALKAQAHETATARFNERLTKLNNMLTDARELMSKLEHDPKAHEPILAEINDQFAESYIPFIVAFFVYLLVALLVDGLLLAFVRPNPEFERAATQRILTEVEESNKNPGDKENKPEPELVICNIPLYPPTTDRQPFKALRDMTRKTGKETPVDKPDTDTGKPGDNDVKL